MISISKFKRVISSAGRELLLVGAAAAVAFLPGLLQAPNLDAAYGVGVAALVAVGSAVLRALQEITDARISFARWVPQPYAAYLDVMVRAGVSAAFVVGYGALNAPDLATARGIITGGVVAVLAAAGRALQGALDPNERPFPASTG